MPKALKKTVVSSDGDGGSDEVQTIFGDLVTFVMMLFILLFVLSYNEEKTQDFITEFQIKFGEKVEEKQQTLTTDALIVSKIQHYIDKEKMEDIASVVVDEHRVKIILNDPVLFQSGKADLKQKGINTLKGLGKIFDNVFNPFVIEGHTDNVPINNDEFKSNWELSFYRAFSVVKYFIYKKKYNPTRLSALGYGEYRPLTTNDTKENRSLNRRIELNIIRLEVVE
tara:strand:+ start:311 stop:985 length:675 start_codon:yes stop_codon:yes gene_type:complete